MAPDRTIRHRKSIRLKDYDYAQAGLYFITICTDNRLPLFGNIVDGVMQLNDSGKIAHDEWQKTASIRPDIVLHEFVVMPNHFHAIIEIVPTAGGVVGDYNGAQRVPTVGDVVRGYKAAVTKGVRAITDLPNAKVWQRNYYEHIVRSEAAYLKIADYIQTNPQRWREDIYYA